MLSKENCQALTASTGPLRVENVNLSECASQGCLPLAMIPGLLSCEPEAARECTLSHFTQKAQGHVCSEASQTIQREPSGNGVPNFLCCDTQLSPRAATVVILV